MQKKQRNTGMKYGGGKAVLTSYLGTDSILEVPLEIEGYTVIGLEGTFKENQDIEKITIPDGIEFLGDETFSRCRKLYDIVLPDSIQKFGWKCFQHSGLETIRIPASMEEIGLMNFYYCENLKSVDFGNSRIKKIQNGAFSFCFNLKNIELPESLEIIDESPFIYCDSLEKFVIPKNVNEINIGISPIVSGKNLKQITNLSNVKYDKDIFDDKEYNYTWFTTEDGYELAEYLPTNSTIYRRKKDSSQKYVDKYLNVLKSMQIPMKDANTKEAVLEWVLSKKPIPDLDSISCDVEVMSFNAAIQGHKYNVDGKEGYATLRINTVNNAIPYDEAYGYTSIDITPIPYKEEEKPSEEETTPDTKDPIKEYVDQVLKSIPEGISMEKVNTKEDAVTYSKGFFDEALLNKYKLDISIESFQEAERGTKRTPSGWRGGFTVYIRSEGMKEYGYKWIAINQIVYMEDENYSLMEKYAEQYTEILTSIANSGISMKIGNTPEALKKYIESLAPKNKNENITYEVKIFVNEGPILFRKAVAGTRDNKSGTNGSCPVSITFKHTLFKEEISIRKTIPILATPYTTYEENSSENSSSSRDDNRISDKTYTRVDNSYENKNTLSDTESLLVTNIATVFFGNSSQVKKIEKTDSGIFIISKNNEVILNKHDGTLAKNEWKLSGKDWYYFDADNKAAKGWKFLGNKWYYLNDTTKKMEIGWLKSPISGKWYYMDLKNGDMLTGWQQVSNQWYYMDSTGAMMANTTTPDGYKVNGNGEWIP